MGVPTKYTYSIQNDFPNHKVAPDRLAKEIQASSIVTALDYIATFGDDCDIWFKDPLAPTDKATLDGIVAAHSGEPLPPVGMPVTDVLPDGSAIPRTQDNMAQFSVWPTEGARVTLVSPNWCDPTTWYGKAPRVVDEVAVWSSANTWQLAHNNIIDTYHGKISNEDFLKDAGGFDYRVHMTVNSVPRTEQNPATGSGGDFVVDYAAGTVTFLDGTQALDDVRATYHYATSSTFVLKPKPGKALKLRRVEVQFSDDVIINDSVTFQAYGLVDVFAPQLMPGVPSGTLIPLGDPVVYKTLMDYINDSNGAVPLIPACGGPGWRGTQHDIITLVWDYAAMTPLYAATGMEIRIALQHEIKMGGTSATATFYCLAEDVP
jgi:hypothetical protein